MKSFFQRLLSSLFGNTADQHPSAPVENAPVMAVEKQPGALGSALPAIGVRRPLISSQGEIVGFEFRIGEDIQRRMSRRDDSKAKGAFVQGVLSCAYMVTQGGRIGLARLPANYVIHAIHAIGMEAIADTFVGVDASNGVQTDPTQLLALTKALQHLRTLGVKVGGDASLNVPLIPDFVMFCQGSQSMPALLCAIKSCSPARQRLPALITDIATFEDLELALQGGVHYVCGALPTHGSTSDAKETVPVSPEVGRIGHLLNQLVTAADNKVIIANIKSDVGLSYRLLQRINTAGFAHLDAGVSIEQSVLMLGRSELYRWLSLLLFNFAGKRKVSSTLQEVALWRSRFLELLAKDNHEESPAHLFTLGLASMMGPILKISITDVLSILRLHANAREALLDRSGPWHIYLQLIEHIEAQNLEDSSPVVEQLGGVAHITALSDAAWDWAWSAMHTHGDKAAPNERPT